MNELSYTLLSDGSSDRVLIPIINWSIREVRPGLTLRPQWADLRRLRLRGLSQRIQTAVELYPSSVLFVHRDAEGAAYAVRVQEIQSTLSGVPDMSPVHSVCIVPVRMTEAWLLFDEGAIRTAAGNPNGMVELNLPPLQQLESITDPKGVLQDKLLVASGLSSRRRKRFRIPASIQRLGELIRDFSQLNSLSAFAALQSEIADMLGRLERRDCR